MQVLQQHYPGRMGVRIYDCWLMIVDWKDRANPARREINPKGSEELVEWGISRVVEWSSGSGFQPRKTSNIERWMWKDEETEFKNPWTFVSHWVFVFLFDVGMLE